MEFKLKKGDCGKMENIKVDRGYAPTTILGFVVPCVVLYLIIRYFYVAFNVIEWFCCTILSIFINSNVYYFDFNWVASYTTLFWVLFTIIMLVTFCLHTIKKDNWKHFRHTFYGFLFLMVVNLIVLFSNYTAFADDGIYHTTFLFFGSEKYSYKSVQSSSLDVGSVYEKKGGYYESLSLNIKLNDCTYTVPVSSNGVENSKSIYKLLPQKPKISIDNNLENSAPKLGDDIRDITGDSTY
jgi:hypothetical protein